MDDNHKEDQKTIHTLETIISILAKSFNQFAHAFDLVRKAFEETEESRRELIKDTRRDAYFIAFITTIGIAGTIAASSYWSHVQEARVQFYKQAGEVNEQVNLVLSKKDLVMTAITKLRSIRDAGQKKCVNGAYSGPDQSIYYEKFYNAEFDLINAYFVTKGILSEQAMDALHKLTKSIDVDTVNICDPKGIQDIGIRAQQGELNGLIMNQIKQLQAQKEQYIIQAEKG